MKFKEGDRVVTCGQVQGFHRDGFFYATKVYEAKVRKRDGALIWKLVQKLNEVACGDSKFRGDFPSPAALKLARVHANEEGIPFVREMKENQEVEGTKVPRAQAKKAVKREPKGNRFDRVRKYVEST